MPWADMIKRFNKVSSPGVPRIQKRSARADFSVYQVFTVGVVLFLFATALVVLSRFETRGRSTVDAGTDTRQASAAPPTTTSGGGNTEFHSQRRPVGFVDGEESSPSEVSALNAMGRLEDVLAKAGPDEQHAAAALRRFATTGSMAELRKVGRQDVVNLAEYLGRELSPDEVGALLHQSLGLSSGTTLPKDKVGSSLVDIYDAIAGNRLEDVRPSALMITDAADAAGRIKGRTDILPAGTQRVYAVFENDRALEGLDQVLTVWRNPSDDRMVFTAFEPVRRGSAYNYVWLDVKSGWPAGRYQVELFHPEAQSLLLASESFSIR